MNLKFVFIVLCFINNFEHCENLKVDFLKSFLFDFADSLSSKYLLIVKDSSKRVWERISTLLFHQISVENRLYSGVLKVPETFSSVSENFSNASDVETYPDGYKIESEAVQFLGNFYNESENVSHISGSSFKKDKGRVLVFAPLFNEKDFRNLQSLLEDHSLARYFWLILHDENSQEFIKSLHLTADNLITLALIQEDNDSILLSDYYRTIPNGNLHKSRVGIWRNTEGEDSGSRSLNKFSLIFNRWKERSNLSEVFFKCATLSSTSLGIPKRLENGTFLPQGPIGGFWHYLQDVLKFSYSCTKKNTVYGSYEENGSWSGVMGDIYEKRANFGLVGMGINPQRAIAVEFLSPLEMKPRVLFYNNVVNLDPSWSQYIKEFSPSVWLAIGLTFLACIICFNIISRWHPSEKVCSYSDASLHIMSTFCNAGTGVYFRSVSGRIFVTTVSLTCFVLLTAYSSFLISTLAVKWNRPPFSDIEGLYNNRNKYKIIFLKGSAAVQYIKSSNISIHRKVWREMKMCKEEDFPINERDLFSIVSKKRVASLLGIGELISQTEFEFASFPLPGNIVRSFVVPKDSPFKNIFNYYIRLFMENGGFSRFRTQNFRWLKHLRLSKTREEPWQSIQINNVKFLLQILGCGIVLSVSILLTELILAKART